MVTIDPDFEQERSGIVMSVMETLRLEAATPAAKFEPDQDSSEVQLPVVSSSLVVGSIAFVEMAVVFLAAIAVKFAYIDVNFDGLQPTLPYAGVAFVATMIATLTFRQTGLYEPERLLEPTIKAGRIFVTLGMTFVLLVALLYVLKVAEQFSRGWMLLWFASSYILIVCERAILTLYSRLLVAEGRLKQRVAVYGRQELVPRVIQHLKAHAPQVSVVACFEETSNGGSDEQRCSTDDLNALLRLGRNNRFDRVIVALPTTSGEKIQAIIAKLQVLPVDIQLCSAVLNLPVKIYGSSNIGQMQLLEIQRRPISEQGLLVKSVLDYVLSTIMLILSAPLFLIIIAAIKLESGGPAFFSQRRNGYNHRVIRVLKFKTMTVMEDGADIKQAEVDDKRVTKVGRFLRRTSLDELPQLINVMKGEMSLVGPRPHAIAHNEHYSQQLEQYANRHRVKPGITGWAQVNGFRGATKEPELMRRRVECDLHYINNWSLEWDIQILARTIWAVLKGVAAH